MNRALQLHQAGKLDPAEKLYRDILRVQPANSDALHLLGLVHLASSRYKEAERLIAKAVQMYPGVASYQNSLGRALQGQGKLTEAAAVYRGALQIDSNLAEAHSNLGSVFVATGQLEDASACYQRAVQLRPTYVDALSDWGAVLRRLGRLDEAEHVLREAIVMRDDHLAAYVNLGAVLQEQGQHQQAMACLARALELDPKNPQVFNNLGLALHASGRLPDALASFDCALALDPQFGNAHWNRSLTLLLSGDLEHGWEEYEWRWQSSDFPSPRRDFAQPAWTGEPLDGRTILIHAEQGLGDTIQFARYLLLVAQRGGRVVFECPADLVRLLQGIDGLAEIVPQSGPLPAFDVQAPLLSLPHIFETRPDSIPAAGLKLNLAARYVERLRDCPRPLVGLIWAGSPHNKIDRRRSMGLRDMAPLTRLTGLTFVALQKGAAGQQAAEPPAGMRLLDLGPELDDFTDTAAVLSQLDAVVSVDTAAAHLAGALGRPVCLLLPAVPDWRWLLGSETTPWYPTMRLFRQRRAGDWSEVLERLVAHLSYLTQ